MKIGLQAILLLSANMTTLAFNIARRSLVQHKTLLLPSIRSTSSAMVSSRPSFRLLSTVADQATEEAVEEDLPTNDSDPDLLKHGNDKSRFKQKHYLLRNLVWVKEGKTLKMYGSTPSGWSKSYSYYVTHVPLGDKVLHLPTATIDDQIPAWLEGVIVSYDLIPALRDTYEKEVKQSAKGNKADELERLNQKFSALADEAGMNPSLVRQYTSGKKYPSEKQAGLIQQAIHRLSEDLGRVQLI